MMLVDSLSLMDGSEDRVGGEVEEVPIGLVWFAHDVALEITTVHDAVV